MNRHEQSHPLPGVTVRVPARTEFVSVLRGVVSSAAARIGLLYEEIEDVRLAVDEACGHLMDVRPPGKTMRVELLEEGGRLTVCVGTDGPTDAWPPAGARRSLAFHILNALAEDVSFEQTDLGPVVRFIKRTSARPPVPTNS